MCENEYACILELSRRSFCDKPVVVSLAASEINQKVKQNHVRV